MKKALLVIDMQEATVGKNHADFFKYDDDLLRRVNNVIGATDAELVVYIKNLMKNTLINKMAPVKVFDGMPEAELAEELKKVSQHVYAKYVGDAFSNADFAKLLRDKQIDTVEVIGVDGGGCVSLTALGAIDNGYRVFVNTSAIGTMFDKKRDKLYEKLRKAGATIS